MTYTSQGSEKFLEAISLETSGDSASAAKMLIDLAEEGHSGAVSIFRYHGHMNPDTDGSPARTRTIEYAALSGYPQAEFSLGARYFDGFGMKKDREKGLAWLQRSVSHGNLDGSYFLGKVLEKKPYNDMEYALELITDAAGGGHALALNDLARKYRDGKVVPRDSLRALELYSASADHGYWVAARHIAEMYLDGDGVQHDPEQALEWFSRAADSGDQESQYQIARMFETGNGVEKDVDEAMRIYALLAINYSHSARRFCNEAAYRLGLILESGTDVPADLEDAIYWYTKAADKGHKEASIRLRELI